MGCECGHSSGFRVIYLRNLIAFQQAQCCCSYQARRDRGIRNAGAVAVEKEVERWAFVDLQMKGKPEQENHTERPAAASRC